MPIDASELPRSLSAYKWTKHFREHINSTERKITERHVATTLQRGKISKNEEDGNFTFEHDFTGIVCYIIVDPDYSDDAPGLVTGWFYLYNPALALEHNSEFTVADLVEIHEFNNDGKSFAEAYPDFSP